LPRSLRRKVSRLLGEAISFIQRPYLRRVRSLPRIRVRSGAPVVGASVELLPPERVTADRKANEQLLYFTTPSLFLDETHLVFLSDRTGDPNLFLRNLSSGREQQLSDNRGGTLKSYVYFTGSPYRGLGMASPSLHAESGTVYYIQGREILQARPSGERKILATLPADQMTAYTHVSMDGTRLCVPTVDARALDGHKRLRGQPTYGVARRVRQENLFSYLRVYSTADGRELACEAIPQSWVTHVQFSPVNPDWILYNHEWGRHSGVRRMWLWDGRRHTPLRTEADGRDRRDWVCHEFWSPDGDSVHYHGRYEDGLDFIGSIRIPGGKPVEIPLPDGWNQYGHYHAATSHSLVTDGYYRPSRTAGALYGPWLSLVDVDWGDRQITWTPLTAHLTSWRSQDAHPHPRIDHSGRNAYFTSDRDGKRAVYRVALPR